MLKILKQSILFLCVSLNGPVIWSGCSSSKITPTLPTPPPYTQVPHPHGTDLADLRALFYDPTAPKMPDFALNCDQGFRKLIGVTQSIDELQQGIRELIRSNPVHFHWCFYSQLLILEEGLKKETYVDEKQKQVLDNFQFLSTIARAFSMEFHDSRYLRYAVVYYKKMSEWVFFRRLDLTPAGTAELVQTSNPFGLWRKSDGGFSILQRYNIQASDPAQPPPSNSPTSLTPNNSPSATPSSLPLAPNPMPSPPTAPISSTGPVDPPALTTQSNPK